jgi:glycosyltransferase involved in cell wall biosynthesis
MSFTVLISVYAKDKPKYFDEAVASIWDSQTLRPGQIVLVKDGPLTKELECSINRWAEKIGKFLTIVPLPENNGLGAALNVGLKQCWFDLVARMDSDDISLPDRFEKQLAFMDANPDIIASSAFIEEIDESGKVVFVRRLPELHENLIRYSKIRSPFNHVAVIYRRNSILGIGGYPNIFPEDWALWALLIQNDCRIANMQEILVKVRVSEEFIYRRGLSFLIGEIKLFRYQKEIGFLTWPEYLRNVTIRIGIRLLPAFVRRWLYKVAR